MVNPRDAAGEGRRRKMVNPRDIARERRRRKVVNPRDIAGERRRSDSVVCCGNRLSRVWQSMVVVFQYVVICMVIVGSRCGHR